MVNVSMRLVPVFCETDSIQTTETAEEDTYIRRAYGTAAHAPAAAKLAGDE